MLRAAIFDVDGLLIDSEPIWRASEIEVFARFGIELTEEMCLGTTGLRIDEVAAHWVRVNGSSASARELAAQTVDLVVERIRSSARPLAGGPEAIEACREMGWKIAAASSSPERVIAAALERLGLTGVLDSVASAEHERYGKPHPAVIFTAAERLGVAPTECVVFEDSVNGCIAAKAARTVCIAVPERDDRRFAIADRVLRSLREVDRALLGSL
jgi:HAD superfamily hydrolase (TIGR01509 family)